MDRRDLLGDSAIAMGSFVSVEGAGFAAMPGQTATPSIQTGQKIGQPVRAVSIGFLPGLSLERVAGLVDEEGARGADIIALAETFVGQNNRSQEALDGPAISTLAGLAEKHRTYIVAPIDRSGRS